MEKRVVRGRAASWVLTAAVGGSMLRSIEDSQVTRKQSQVASCARHTGGCSLGDTVRSVYSVKGDCLSPAVIATWNTPAAAANGLHVQARWAWI